MRLRTKLFLVTLLASLVPIGLATWAGRSLLVERSQRDFEVQLDQASAQVKRRFEELSRQVESAVKRLANADDHFVGPMLIAQASGGPDAAMFQQLPAQAPRVMTERGLDVLTVYSHKRRILASGHFPGRIGDTDEKLPGERFGPSVRKIRAMISGRPTSRMAMLVGKSAKSPLGARLFVLGGRFIDQALVDTLRLPEGTELRLASGATELGVTTRYRGYGLDLATSRTLVLGGGKISATLRVSHRQLQETLRLIDGVALGLGGFAFVLATLLAIIGGRITRPLERLTQGVRAVAAGDLGTQIDIRSRDEVGELVSTFNRMSSDLADSRSQLAASERIAAWRDIARHIAHEVKNPLSPIQTAMETLRKVYSRSDLAERDVFAGNVSFNEIFEESTSTILEEVERLKRLVSEFSNFARMPKPQLKPDSPAEWLRGVLSLYLKQDSRITLQLDNLPAQVSFDREQLTQVVVNLLQNAIHAVEEQSDGSVEIRSHSSDGSWIIEVEDNGVGFAADQAAKLFQPYFTSKQPGKGTGLGLAICHRIVSDHGGVIGASAGQGGRGACFRVMLPVGDTRES